MARRFGPGLLITAAFIGPGTVTTASTAGAGFGLTLTWALLFSVVTTIILQEMAARLGIVTRQGISETLRSHLRQPWLRFFALGLVIVAIGLGNAAYQTGNLLGATLGAAALLPVDSFWLTLTITSFATLLLASGTYRLIESVLILMVILMSLVFIAAFLLAPPSLTDLIDGLIPTGLPDAATLTVIALIGTTVVPYNLFLHANSVQQAWGKELDTQQALTGARWDTGLSVSLGGLVTLAIMSTAATAFFGTGTTVSGATLATQLEPVLGVQARYFIAAGLLAAGLTSAVTAPLAAAYAICGAMGWPAELRSLHFRLSWLAIMVFGATFALLQSKPLYAILIAQAANGLLLPFITAILLWVMNLPALGGYRNRLLANFLGGAILLITLLLGGYKLFSLLG
ncbi:MAG: Nramp family divalent metal transporter [Pseudomonadales bacterium]|nr:Nramp family divalent metal transporter [Pseudomonadales bacterium]